MRQRFTIFKGNAVESARRIWSGREAGSIDSQDIEFDSSTEAHAYAKDIATKEKATVSVADETFEWCWVYGEDGEVVDHYQNPHC